MFERGDIVADSTGTKGIVLQHDEDMVHLLLHDFTTTWVDEKYLRKVGSTYAIYRSMYDLSICEVK